MTQAELAKAVGVTQAYISTLESGKRLNPSLQTLLKIADALGVSVEKLIRSYQKAV